MTGGTKCFLLIWTKKINAVLATLKKKLLLSYDDIRP